MTTKRGQAQSKRPGIHVPRPVYDRLVVLQQKRAQETGRDSVTFGEVIEQLLSRAEGFELLANHAQVVDLADRKPVQP